MVRYQVLLFGVAGLVACNAVLGLDDVTRAPASGGTGGGAGAGRGSSADGGSSGKGGGVGGKAGSQGGGGIGAEAGSQGEAGAGGTGGSGAEAGNTGEGGAGTGSGGEGGGGPVECGTGTFDDDGDANTPCRAWTDCERGQHILQDGTADSDRTCAACDSGTFSDEENVTSCTDWTDCLPGTFVSLDGDTDSDRECDDCPSGYQSTMNNQAQCLLPGACQPGTVQITPPTMTDPAVCDACDDGTFCAGGDAPVVPCDDDNWDHDADPATSCAAWTGCIAGSRVDQPGSATENRTCTPCTNGTFSTAANAPSCTDWRTCPAGTYTSTPGSSTVDRSCTGCAGGTFTATANQTSCADWRTCAAGTYMSTAGSGTADRICMNCASGSFSASANQTSCTTWRTCSWPQGGVATAGTSTSDAVCGTASPFRQFGTSAEDNGPAVAVDAGGNVYVAGATQGALNGSNLGSYDAYLRKYNSSGTHQWTVQFGTAAEDRALGVAVDASNGVYVVGHTAGVLGGTNSGGADGYPRKYLADGTYQWTQQFGTSATDEVVVVALDVSGSIYVAGNTQGDLVGTNAGAQDVFVRRFTSGGGIVWTQQFGISTNDVVFGIALDATAVYVSGNTDGSLSGTSAGAQDAYLRKYNPSGTHQWTQQFGTTVVDLGRGVALDASGNPHMVGFTMGSLVGTNAGGYDGYLRKFDATGAHVWTQQYGTSTHDYAQDVIVSPAGNIDITGYTQGALVGTNAGMADFYVRQHNAAGTHQWTQQWGTSTGDFGFGIAVDAGNNLYASGNTQGALVGTSAGGQDAFVVQIPGG